ncbi:MAG: hypothetical protein IKW06_06405 [Clostridia bacterium]|nr:hypothetical protein [Clostridia bacterium]
MKKNVITNCIIIAIIAGLSAVLDLFAVIGFPTGILSVSSFYVSSAFYVLFVYLFGWRGSIGIYIGLILASITSGGFSFFPIYGAWGNVLASVFIVYVMKALKRNCSIKNAVDFITLAVLYLIAPLISAFWVLGGWVVVGIIPKEAFLPALFPWWFGGVCVYFIIATPLLKFISPIAKKYNL